MELEATVFLNDIERLEVNQKKGHCFVAHEYPVVKPDDYREKLKIGLAPDFYPIFADEHYEFRHILPKICKFILATDFGVYDVSNPNKANIFLELGIAIGMNKPVIITQCINSQLIPQANCELPFGLRGLDVFRYRSYVQLQRNIGSLVVNGLGSASKPVKVTRYCAVCHRSCDAQVKTTQQKIRLVTAPSDYEDFRPAIEGSLSESGLKIQKGEQTETGRPELCILREQLQQARLGIYNISEPWMPTVFLQLGIAIGSCHPWLLVLRKGHKAPTDLEGYERIEFETFSILEQRLKKRIKQIIKNLYQVESEQIAKKVIDRTRTAIKLWKQGKQESWASAVKITKQCITDFSRITTTRTLRRHSLLMFEVSQVARTQNLPIAAQWADELFKLFERLGLDEEAESTHYLLRSINLDIDYQQQSQESPL